MNQNNNPENNINNVNNSINDVEENNQVEQQVNEFDKLSQLGEENFADNEPNNKVNSDGESETGLENADMEVIESKIEELDPETQGFSFKKFFSNIGDSIKSVFSRKPKEESKDNDSKKDGDNKNDKAEEEIEKKKALDAEQKEREQKEKEEKEKKEKAADEKQRKKNLKKIIKKQEKLKQKIRSNPFIKRMKSNLKVNDKEQAAMIYSVQGADAKKQKAGLKQSFESFMLNDASLSVDSVSKEAQSMVDKCMDLKIPNGEAATAIAFKQPDGTYIIAIKGDINKSGSNEVDQELVNKLMVEAVKKADPTSNIELFKVNAADLNKSVEAPSSEPVNEANKDKELENSNNIEKNLTEDLQNQLENEKDIVEDKNSINKDNINIIAAVNDKSKDNPELENEGINNSIK